MSTICRFIHAEKANYTIVLLCTVIKAARSTYYAWVAGREARQARRRADEASVDVSLLTAAEAPSEARCSETPAPGSW